MTVKCSLCGKGCGLYGLLSWKLKDGVFCNQCYKNFRKIGLDVGENWYSDSYTIAEAKNILVNSEAWKEEILKRNEEYIQLQQLNTKCLICKTDLSGVLSAKYFTSDGRALCFDCKEGAMTISPKEFLENKDNYIENHDSNFFLENMGHIEFPHTLLVVNFNKQCFYDKSGFFTNSKSVFSFDSVIKFESDMYTYEVTVGKKGHPIARAVIGKAVFGPAGAVVGAMTAKNTKHQETRGGKKYISIYQKDNSEKSGIRKREFYCKDDLEVAKLEDCLKRVFDFRDEQKQVQKNAIMDGNEYTQLIELKKLLDLEIITQEEFDKKKKELLNL